MAVADTGIQLWVGDLGKLGAWNARQKVVIGAINELLLVLYRSSLTGTSQLNLRKSISLALGVAKRKAAKDQLGITLLAP
jgi:hypothetical protein